MSKGRRSRYGNIKQHKYDGHTFDSKREMLRYQELVLAQRAGVIGDLVVHPRIKLIVGGVPIRTDAGRVMQYEADFRYYDWEAGEMVYEDVKMQSGHRTETYRMKRAIVRAMGIEILET